MVDNDKISGIQLWIFITLTAIGVGVFSLPRLAAESANEDGWISVLLGGVMALVNFFIISRLVRKFPQDTLVEIAQKSLGKFLALPVLIIFWLYMLFICAMTLRIFGEVVKMSLLIRTPIEVINISILLLALWLVRGGIEPITRFNEVVFPILAVTVIFVTLFALPRSDFSNILPILRSGTTRILNGAYQSTYSYAGYEFVLLIAPFIRKPDKVFKSGIIAFVLIALFYVSMVVLSFAKFGVQDTKKLIWPTLTLIRSIEVPGSFVERLEGVVMTQWILLAFTTVVPLLFGICIVPSRILKHKEFKHFCAIVVPVIYILSLVPDNIVESYKYLDWITIYFEAPSVFAIPVLLLIIAYIRRVGDVKNG